MTSWNESRWKTLRMLASMKEMVSSEKYLDEINQEINRVLEGVESSAYKTVSRSGGGDL